MGPRYGKRRDRAQKSLPLLPCLPLQVTMIDGSFRPTRSLCWTRHNVRRRKHESKKTIFFKKRKLPYMSV